MIILSFEPKKMIEYAESNLVLKFDIHYCFYMMLPYQLDSMKMMVGFMMYVAY